MTLEAIKEAITELPPGEKTRLAAWLLQQEREEWDRQIEKDFSPGGHGMALLEEAELTSEKGGPSRWMNFWLRPRLGAMPGQSLNHEPLPILHHFALLETVRGTARRWSDPQS